MVEFAEYATIEREKSKHYGSDIDMPEHPHLKKLSDHLVESRHRLEEMAHRPKEQLKLKPHKNSWSALETAEHVRLTNELYLNVLPEVIESADKSNPDEPFRPRIFGRLFIKLVSPDPTFKVKTVSAATPDSHSTDLDSLQKLIGQQDDLLAVLAKADQVNLNRTKVKSPLNGLVKFTLGEALSVMVLHQLRHLQQMDRALG
ncbi:MAG: DinB family protein [Candidatus Latescibacterota bacterium]